MKVFLSRKAAKALNGVPPDVKRRLEEKISELFKTSYPAGCRKLRGAANAYRLRVGDYRILYVMISKNEILVFKVVRREVAYR
jgi:mRNA interferase RelE/StbE